MTMKESYNLPTKDFKQSNKQTVTAHKHHFWQIIHVHQSQDSIVSNICSFRPETAWNFTEQIENVNQYVDTHFKHVSRHPRVSKPKHNMKQGKKRTIVIWSLIFIELIVLAEEPCKVFFVKKYQKYEFGKYFGRFRGQIQPPQQTYETTL